MISILQTKKNKISHDSHIKRDLGTVCLSDHMKRMIKYRITGSFFYIQNYVGSSIRRYGFFRSELLQYARIFRMPPLQWWAQNVKSHLTFESVIYKSIPHRSQQVSHWILLHSLSSGWERYCIDGFSSNSSTCAWQEDPSLMHSSWTAKFQIN